MDVLIACEFSGIVRDAFIARDNLAKYNVISCDLLPTERPGPHFTCDVRDILNDGWDLMIAFPPCTYLCRSGAQWWDGKKKLQQEALEFVRTLMRAPIPKICIENPVGIISTRIRKPDQIIQPFEFGHPVSKKTCLWLKNLPLLKPTKIVEPNKRFMANFSKKNRGKNRSRTFSGIAQAMASQWD